MPTPTSIQVNVRDVLATALAGVTASVYASVPEALIPPACVIVPGSPYMESTLIGKTTVKVKLNFIITAAVAVGSLNASPTIGEVQTVNDALAVTVKGATVAAGGSAVCQVMWNGANWVGT